MTSNINIGVIVIGRNEGDRLKRCVRCALKDECKLVYVDSGSDDDSVDWCHAQGVDVVELDTSLPFTAARARNAGVRRLRQLDADLAYIQFVDGDSELQPGWLNLAAATLDQNQTLAVVCGRLNEAHPQLSIYNRMCDLEWANPIGEIDSCGGLFMVRLAALEQVGGFNANIRAGEEPELCRRLRDGGWRIVRLDTPMARHDAAMLSLRQWCRRQMRSAYGALEVYMCYDVDEYRRYLASAWWWGAAWPIALTLAATLIGPVGAAAVGLVMLLQMARVAYRMRRRGCSRRIAGTYGMLVMLAKWPQLWGQWLYLLDRRRRKKARRFEGKRNPATI